MSTEPGPALRGAASETAILITVALTTMLAPLNSTMIGVALPGIMGEFATDLETGSWLVTAYLISMASLQPVCGKLGDRFGRRPLILAGLVYFGVASIGAATASSLAELLIFRIQQGIAGALALPNGMALVREPVPAVRRASRIGLLGSAIVLAAAAGPPLGGLLIRLAGWRSIFYVNLLLIVPALVIALWALPSPDRDREHRHSFDLVGALQLLAILLGGAALMTGALSALPPLATWGVAAVLVGLTAVFLRREALHDDPIFQPRFFRRTTFAAGCAVVSLSNLSMYTAFLAIPLLLANLPSWSSTQVGLVLAALWAPSVVFAPLGGILADRWGRRWPTTLGLSLLTIGMAALFALESGEGEDLWVLLIGLGVAGIGLGLSQAGLQTGVLESVTSDQSGSASGVFSTSRYIGSIAGSSALPMLYASGDEMAGFMRVLSVVVIAALASTGASLWLQHRPSPD